MRPAEGCLISGLSTLRDSFVTSAGMFRYLSRTNLTNHMFKMEGDHSSHLLPIVSFTPVQIRTTVTKLISNSHISLCSFILSSDHLQTDTCKHSINTTTHLAYYQ